MSPPFASLNTKGRIREAVDGERDPDGEGKDAAEARLLKLLKERLDGQYAAIAQRLGWPPDLNNLDAEFWATEEGLLLATLRPEIEAMARQAIATTSATVPILWDEPVIALDAVRWAEQYAYDLVTRLNNNTQALLRRKIPQFIETPGMTVGDLRRELAPAFGEVRAQMIATTEVTRAFAQGTAIVQAQLMGGGVRMVRIWHTSADERVCELCAPFNGEPEGVWGEPPPAHVNCRCWTTLKAAA